MQTVHCRCAGRTQIDTVPLRGGSTEQPGGGEWPGVCVRTGTKAGNRWGAGEEAVGDRERNTPAHSCPSYRRLFVYPCVSVTWFMNCVREPLHVRLLCDVYCSASMPKLVH